MTREAALRVRPVPAAVILKTATYQRLIIDAKIYLPRYLGLLESLKLMHVCLTHIRTCPTIYTHVRNSLQKKISYDNK